MKFSSEPQLRVGIMVESNIRIHFLNEFSHQYNNDIIIGKAVAYCDADNNLQLSVNDRQFVIDRSIVFMPLSADCRFELSGVSIGQGFHWEKHEVQQFEGALELTVVDEKVQVVNIINIEKYLTSVISSEMQPNASLEFLKAHAVISRSWMLARLLESESKPKLDKLITAQEISIWYGNESHDGFDVCADDHCQRYQGLGRIISENAQKAVTETYGEVLMYANTICDARFSKSCGGVTESFENVWEAVNHPYLMSVYDNADNYPADLRDEKAAQKWILSSPKSHCNCHDNSILSKILNPYDLNKGSLFRWEFEYSQQTLSDIIRKKSGIDFGFIINLIPLERGYSGRISRLKIQGTKKQMIVGKELEIRRWLSETHLYSSAIVVQPGEIINGVPQTFLFVGAGWGHGVGLCQIGAAVMGESGYNYKKILSSYYKSVDIKRVF